VSRTGDELSGTADRLAGTARELAAAAGRRTGADEYGGGAPEPLAAVRAASELVALADRSLRLSVDAARKSGHTWQEIGDLLGVTRQAAFQRFGHPIDPRTGRPMSEAILPGAAERGTQLMIDWIEQRYDEVAADFDQTVAEKLPASQLPVAWAQLTGMVGAYQRMGEATVHAAGDLTVVDIPMTFEASEMKGRVVYNAGGEVAGLFVLKPDAI
jgi:Protein of unknown function (DUF3887)